MMSRVKHCVLYPVKKGIKWALYSFGKPILEYLELHLTDQCNLNCKGCGHFSPIAPPRNADINQHERDMQRLSQLFHNIDTIRLMGGEPLLHPDPAAFITKTKSIFPKSCLHFVTNGILLPKAPKTFFDACRETNTIIDVTVYPPFRNRVAEWRSLCNSKNVNLNLSSEIQTFFAHLNLRGDSDEKKSFDLCRSRYFCPFLRDGHIYTCATPALIHYYNDHFGYQIPGDRGINIHSQSLSGKGILRYLNKPIVTCRWCSYGFVPFPWTLNCPPIFKDWVVG